MDAEEVSRRERALYADVAMDWLLLHGAAPMDAEQIADATGMDLGLVHSTISQGLAKIRRGLAQRGVSAETVRRYLVGGQG